MLFLLARCPFSVLLVCVRAQSKPKILGSLKIANPIPSSHVDTLPSCLHSRALGLPENIAGTWLFQVQEDHEGVDPALEAIAIMTGAFCALAVMHSMVVAVCMDMHVNVLCDAHLFLSLLS